MPGRESRDGDGLERREHAVMVLDRAGWNTSRTLRRPKRITPIVLPPHSPELNRVERVWPWLHRHCWSDGCLEAKHDLIIEALGGRSVARPGSGSVAPVWPTPPRHADDPLAALLPALNTTALERVVARQIGAASGKEQRRLRADGVAAVLRRGPKPSCDAARMPHPGGRSRRVPAL
ncbi:MAG TPA: transposase [Phycisphaerales bacterium]|nr:transposase [Phycisphaerales bacterium]HMP38264.1 transposase [Phycisphaerales bacterium]